MPSHNFSDSVYPELYALIGAKTPDFRGLFLRGYGQQTTDHFGTVNHSSGKLGVTQGDSIRSGTGYGELELFCAGAIVRKSGVFSKSYTSSRSRDQSGWSGAPNGIVIFDMSTNTPTSNEIRPVNTAVRYLIRSKP